MSQPSSVRVRYAPSPTGYLHVGGVRALLFNWLYAQHTSGQIVLRIEDTDQQRSTLASEKMVIEDIDALQITFNESPSLGGKFAPYRQSERFNIYAEHAKKLLDSGKAYYCFCSPELITQKREAALKLGRIPHYDGTCTKIPNAEASARVAKGEKAGLRFKVNQRSFVLNDLVRGSIEFKEGTVGDFFITRSPTADEQEAIGGVGMPVYNFACVVDDHLMQMSHVIRGEDHLSNTARQLMIYDAFGWTPPLFAHSAMVLGADRQKLSKRNGDVATHDYLEKGYIPQAILNFLVLLGWWPPADFKPASGHPEILSLEEMIRVFSIEGMQKSSAVFDVQKLNWMNSHYIKHLPAAEVAKLARPFFDKSVALSSLIRAQGEQWYVQMIELIRTEAVLLGDLPGLARIFLDEDFGLSEQAKPLLSQSSTHGVVTELENAIVALGRELNPEDFNDIRKTVADKTGAKGKGLFMPIRSAVTGQVEGPELKGVFYLLGKEKVLKRIRQIKSEIGIK